MLYTRAGPPNDVVALDAVDRAVVLDARLQAVAAGAARAAAASAAALAILGDTLFMGTIDAHLIAIDAKTGRDLWNTSKVARAERRVTRSRIAPLVVKDKIIVGTGGGDFGVRGFIAAFDAKTGKEAVALLHDSRARRAGQRDVGGRLVEDRRRRVWNSGAYDPEPNLVFFGTGNPGPDWDGDDAARRQPLQRQRGRARSPTPAR